MFKYYSQHMHMHSCFQPGASMEGHMYHAHNLNMKYIWFTDHDIRMGRKQYPIDGFDFEEPELIVQEADGRSHGFYCTVTSGNVSLSTGNTYQGKQCLQLSDTTNEESWSCTEVMFWSSGKRHTASLLAGVLLELAFRTECTDWKNARFMINIQLSQRPPEHEPAHIIYVIGNQDGLEVRPHTLVLPLEATEEWSSLACNLSEMALSKEAEACSIGGLDNAFDTIMFRVEARCGAAVTAWVDDFKISVEKTAQETLEMQRTVAKEIGKLYDIVPFVGMEISEAGPHKNCFSSKVPIIPYEKMDYKVSHQQGCEWVIKQGGIFAYNHPFERYKGMDLGGFDLETEVDNMVEEFIQNAAWGARLLEVGFPEGRYFPLKYHLKLWDALGLHGIFLTGYGSSDNHSNQSGWYSGNNFATWFGVDAQKEKPKEEDFVFAMKSGNAYTGDPCLITGEVTLETEEGFPMGTIVETGLGTSFTIKFYCSETKHGWKQKWIVDGDVAKETIITADDFEDYCYVDATQALRLVRVEMYDENGRCILLTNPIYIYCRDLSQIYVTTERLVRI